MTVKDIENYLSYKNEVLDKSILDIIEKYRLAAIRLQDEEKANYFWCLKQIYTIQQKYLSAFHLLQDRKFRDSWDLFDNADIDLCFLERNFDIHQGNDLFHLVFIEKMIKEYQKLYPYKLFISRESIVKSEVCSICGRPISLHSSCGHKVGKLYMGELCLRIAKEIEFKRLCVVNNPFDKYSVLEIPGEEFNYENLEKLMTVIKNPYQAFQIKTCKVKKPEYLKIGRNASCPCGSGKKYKKCHLGTDGELMMQYIVTILASVYEQIIFYK